MPKLELRRINRTKPESTYIRREFSRNVTSQFGEDGMIAKIFELIGVENHWCVEFGAWDGKYLSNTWDLINNKGWHAVLMEGHEERAAKLAESYAERSGEVFVKHAFVGWEGRHRLDVILSETPIPPEFDLLSIDIDGNDWHVWNALDAFHPRRPSPRWRINIRSASPSAAAFRAGPTLRSFRRIVIERLPAPAPPFLPARR
jgi:hypothetical protein